MGKKNKDSVKEVDGQENETSETEVEGSDASSETVEEGQETSETDGAELEGSLDSGETEVVSRPGVHALIESAARAAHTAPQHVSFALRTVEMLTGRLKTAIPDAIKATDDEALKAHLQELLDIL